MTTKGFLTSFHIDYAGFGRFCQLVGFPLLAALGIKSGRAGASFALTGLAGAFCFETGTKG